MRKDSNRYDVVFFDFDGTISESKEGITKSTQVALRSFGIEVTDLNTLEPFVGPPLEDSFKKYYRFDDAQTKKAVSVFRSYYIKHGIFEQKIYVGIDDLIKSLYKNIVTCAIATCKPTHLTKIALERYGIIDYLDPIVGSKLDGSRKSKRDVLSHAISKFDGVAKSKMLMVGDRSFDLMAANDLGIDCIGVLYGYGDYEELIASKPTYLVKSVAELTQILL